MFSSAFSASIQALSAYSQGFAAISDNVVNVNTSGYKDTQIQFRDLVANSARGSIYDNLGGARPVVRSYAQHEGAIQFTARDLDAAMSGKGYFLSNSSVDGSGDYLMTAAGHFDLSIPSSVTNDETYIVDQAGNYLLGWPYDPVSETYQTGTSVSSLSAIQVDDSASTYDAIATSTASARLNIPSNAAIGDSHTFSIGIYDGSGSADSTSDVQQINFTWTKTANNAWDMTVTAEDGTVTTPAVTTPVTFGALGTTPDINGTGSSITVGADWNNSGVSTSIAFDFSEISQFAGPFSIDDYETNGIEEGTIQSVAFGENGVILGSFTNGLVRPIAKIPSADVVSPEHLERVGETHFKATSDSGDIELYEIDATDRVQFLAQAFESSATNLSQEMTNMIVMQRAYSSAATSLKTIDEMFKTATDLK